MSHSQGLCAAGQQIINRISRSTVGLAASNNGPMTTNYTNQPFGGRRTSMTVTGQPAVNYAYDNANRLTGLTQSASSVSLVYDNANRRTSLTLPNGVVAVYSYDRDAHVAGITYSMGSTQLGGLVYRYDVDGRLVERSGSLGGTNLPAAVGSATYDAANNLTSWNGTDLEYDLNGNIQRDITSNRYTWDARNHLTAINFGSTASFVYDAFERRMSRTISGAVTQFLYDGLNPVQELNSSNVATANLLTGLNIDEIFRRTDSSGARSFLTNMLGSTLALTDSSGTIQTQYMYEPFGNVTVSGAANGNSYQFTGRENDGTGLYFYRARYYSPTFQRFVSQDPIGFDGGDYNLYGYVLNSPVIFSDPTGDSLANCLRQLAELGRILNRIRGRSQERQNVPTSCQDTGHKKAIDQAGNQLFNQAATAKNACAPYLQKLAEIELILEEAEDLLALP